MKNLLLLTFTLCFTPVIMACSCLELKALTKQEVQEASQIFTGKVVAIDTLVDNRQIEVLISISETIKGEEVNERIIKTNLSSAACGLTLKLGQDWFFLITEFKGELRVNMCGRHHNITKPRFRLCKKKRGSYRSQREFYKANLQKVETYKKIIASVQETI